MLLPARPLVLAVAIAACTVAMPASAQDRVFSIPAGDLKSAVDSYIRQTGAQLLYKSEDLQGARSTGATGSMTSEEALSKVLEGTGVTSNTDAAGAIVLVRRSPRVSSVEQAEGRVAAESIGPSRSDGLAQLDQITVTAQRRPEAAQDVPISLTTFSAGSIESQRITNLADVSRLTPGLLVSAFSASNPTIAIRGANNTFSQMGVSKPVAVVVDDVFMPRNTAANFELFDLESLTVLKGPQGTLFGRNVTGGAVVISTQRPEYETFAAKAQLGFGNYNAIQADGLMNIPVGDHQALKLTIATRDRDGIGRDRLSGADSDDQESRNLRAQWRLGLGDYTEALISADYSEDSNGSRTLSSTSVGNDFNRRTSEVGVPQSYDRTLSGVSVKLAWSMPWGDVTSISAFRHGRSHERYSGVGANYAFLTSGAQSLSDDAENLSTATQELRYSSPLWDTGSFQAGIFLMDEDGARQLGQRSLAAGSGRVTADTLADQDVETRSASVFADGTWHATPSLDLTAGARYTYDRKVASLVRSNFLSPTASFQANGLHASWGEFTPRVAANWHITEASMLYASVSKGFTAGGFNTEASSVAALTNPFDPETVLAKEIGYKSQWLDNRLRFNMSVFEMDYQNKQEFINNTLTGILSIVNASSATIRGTELEVAWRPVAWLGLSATYGYLDSTYDRFEIGNINYTGNTLASSPRNKASLAADWRIPARVGTIFGAVSYGWQSDYNTGAAQDPNLEIPDYGLMNMNFGLEAVDQRWRVQFWMRNVTNKDYILTRSTATIRSEYLGEPRMYGISAGFRY